MDSIWYGFIVWKTTNCKLSLPVLWNISEHQEQIYISCDKTNYGCNGGDPYREKPGEGVYMAEICKSANGVFVDPSCTMRGKCMTVVLLSAGVLTARWICHIGSSLIRYS